MSYINETDFVIENKKLVYPEIVADGLQLYYDAKGKRDTDYHRDTMLDMSGNKNHGKLYNFAYEKSSGYKDGLVFDYIDDKLVRPELDLKPNDFTFMLNGNIISFSPDGTVKRVQDGEVIESKGLIPNAQDLIDCIEYKGNILGDMENIIDGLYKTEPLSGMEIFTDKADDSVVHVEIDGKSYQHAGSGKNLLNVKTYKGSINHVTGEEQISESSSMILSDFIKVKPNTLYRLGRKYNESNNDLGRYFYNKNKEYITGVYGGIDHTYLNADTPEDAEYMKVSYSINDTFVQLEEGSTTTEYEPPAPSPDYPIEIHSLNDFDVVSQKSEGGMIDKINLSLNEPLRSVGDVKDRLFRDSDGLWKVERKTKEIHMGSRYKVTNDGTASNTQEGIKLYNLSGYITIRMNGRTTHINSTHFSYNSNMNLGNYAKLYHVGMNGPSGTWAHSLTFAVPEDDFPTLASFNNWLVEEENNGTPVTLQVQLRPEDIHTETLDQELQDKLNNLRSFEDSNYVYTVLPNENNYLSDNLKPTIHAKFLYNNWYKEDRVINNLMIYNRALTNEEMLQNYKTIKRRWGM